MRRVRLTSAVQIGAVAFGYALGLWVRYPGRPFTIYFWLALLAAIILVFGMVVSVCTRNAHRAAYRVALAALAYMVFTAFTEPFLFIETYPAAAIVSIWFVPLLLAIGSLIRAGAWISAAGVALFVFTSAAMCASNASVANSGSGFFAYWTT
jgi:hypothetical protein